jgi:hypothetical protein
MKLTKDEKLRRTEALATLLLMPDKDFTAVAPYVKLAMHIRVLKCIQNDPNTYNTVSAQIGDWYGKTEQAVNELLEMNIIVKVYLGYAFRYNISDEFVKLLADKTF